MVCPKDEGGRVTAGFVFEGNKKNTNFQWDYLGRLTDSQPQTDPTTQNDPDIGSKDSQMGPRRRTHATSRTPMGHQSVQNGTPWAPQSYLPVTGRQHPPHFTCLFFRTGDSYKNSFSASLFFWLLTIHFGAGPEKKGHGIV